MNDNQKERLLKLAETNPELAKEMLDIFKDEKPASQEPIAVKVVKAEEDKLTFTEEQKKWVVYLISSYIVGIIVAIYCAINIFLTNSIKPPTEYFVIFAMDILCLIFIQYVCVYKAGMPVIKDFMSKHFKYLPN